MQEEVIGIFLDGYTNLGALGKKGLGKTYDLNHDEIFSGIEEGDF